MTTITSPRIDWKSPFRSFYAMRNAGLSLDRAHRAAVNVSFHLKKPAITVITFSDTEAVRSYYDRKTFTGD